MKPALALALVFFLMLVVTCPVLAAQPAVSYATGIEPPPAPALTTVPVLGLVKMALLLVFASAVFYVTNWTFLDAHFVNTSRALWGGVVLAGGVAGLSVAALMPWFYFGLPLGAVLFGGAAVGYATHRNALVTDPLKVLTPAHVGRIKRRLAGRKAAQEDERGPVMGVGRDIIFMGLDDLPIRLEAATAAQREANREVERVLYEAIVRRASTVGYLGKPQKGEVRFRIDGEMVSGGDIERPAADQFAASVKRLAGLDPGEVRKPQEGRLRGVVAGQMFELRIKTAGTVRGEQVVIRIIDVAAALRPLEDLGLSADHLLTFKEGLAKRPGLVILSSPRESGLTTTLHACLRHYDRYINNVIAFEPHKDVEIENVQHFVLNQEDGPVAAAAVRTQVRLEPDIVAVDSLYVAEVAQVLDEAIKEHTVVAGLRAADTTQALMRMGALLGSRETLADRLQLIVNQRLVRLLCPECHEGYRPNPDFIRKANLDSALVEVLYRPPTRLAVKDGKVVVCPRCHNDRYVGRTGLFELMPVDDEIRDLIRRGAPVTDLRTAARKQGMRNLQEEGLNMVIAGLTSIEEVLRVIKQET